MSLREANRWALADGVFDVLIVGAGINGASAAAALAAHGARVALIDRGDFGGLTSQASSNLVWGGIKYLEGHEYKLVWDLCGSRNRLLRAYPTNIREVRFYTAVERGFRWPPPLMNVGTWGYWLFGRGKTRGPRLLTRSRIASEEPVINVDRMAGGVEYSDAYLVDNDARFVFGFVRDALDAGAVAVNYMQMLEAKRAANGHWRAVLKDGETGAELEVESKILINAAGPLADDVAQRLGIETEHRHVYSKGVHLVVDRLTPHERVLTFFDNNGRLFFVIPMGPRSVIGTTDTPSSDPEERVTAADRQFLLENANQRLRLDRPLTEADIISERCGVRPLVVERGSGENTGEQAWLQLSRKHSIDTGEGVLSIYGGKLTDCLNIGEEVLQLVGKMGVRTEPRVWWYGEPPEAARVEMLRRARLMGIDRLAERGIDPPPGEREALSERLWRRYGLRSFALLEDMQREPEMAQVLIAGAYYRRCELYGTARSEMVTRLGDFLRRRSKIASVIPHGDLRHASGIREACDILFGDDAERRYREYFDSDAP